MLFDRNIVDSSRRGTFIVQKAKQNMDRLVRNTMRKKTKTLRARAGGDKHIAAIDAGKKRGRCSRARGGAGRYSEKSEWASCSPTWQIIWSDWNDLEKLEAEGSAQGDE